MGYDLGVDLGTTFVAAAVARPDQIEIFTLGDRSVVAPSVVYRRDDGELVTGEAANRRAVSSPDRIAREFKRRLGDPTPVMLGGSGHSVTELLGALLRDVLRQVTQTEGASPGKVVLTHPANWGPFRRGLFEEVPDLAGLTDVSLITEPEGAAAHYAASRRLKEGEIVAVYDLGGGTFDATVLRSGPEGVEILGIPEGIERLGGVDFDEAILGHVNYAAGGALDELDKRDPQTAVALARLRQDCVLAKESLSRDNEAVIPVFLPGKHFEVRLTRTEFEDMIRAPIESSISALARTLRSAEVSPGDLSAVLLVGGSSRIPLVAKMVSEELEKPTLVDTHPKYAVALGAATVARVQSNQQSLSGRRPVGAGKTSAAASQRAFGKASGNASTATASSNNSSRSLSPGRPASAPPATPNVPERSGSTSGDRRGSRRPLLLGLAVLVVVVVIAGVLLVVNSPGSGSAASSSQTAAQSAAALPPPAPSVPIPTLGTAVPVGATPGFAAMSPNGRLVYIANGNAKLVTVLDTSVNRVVATIPIPAGPPQFLTFSPDGRRAYISIFNDSGSVAVVAVLDTTTNALVGQVGVRSRPYRAAVTADGKTLYVPNHDSGTVSMIDTASLKVIREIKVPPDPHWIEFSKDGTRAFMADHESNLIGVLDVASSSVIGQIPVGTSPHALAVHPTRPLVANVNFDSNSVTMIDTNTNKVTATIPVGKNPQAIAWSPDGRFAYTVNDGDNTVSVINPDTAKVTATIPTGSTPTSIAVLPNGRQAYVTDLGAGDLTVLNLSG